MSEATAWVFDEEMIEKAPGETDKDMTEDLRVES